MVDPAKHSRKAATAAVIITSAQPGLLGYFQFERKDVLKAQVISLKRTSALGGMNNSVMFRAYTTKGPFQSPLSDLGDQASRNLIGRHCEVQLISSETTLEPEHKQIHYGRVVSRSLERFPTGEDVVFTSRFDDYMYGLPVRGMPTTKGRELSDRVAIPTKDAHLLDEITIVGNIVFNPILDGVLIPNKTHLLRKKIIFSFETAIPIFVDPNQMDRSLFVGTHEPPQKTKFFFGFVDLDERSKELHEKGLTFWTLAEAVYHICWACNPEEKHIENPEIEELIAVFDDAVPDDVGQYLMGTTIPNGTSMIGALRKLCIPYGIDFWIDYYDVSKRRLKFVVINHYWKFSLPVSAIGSVIDLRVDAAPELNMSIDSVDKVLTEVEVLGSIPRIEVTLPLMPAWRTDQDDISANEINLTDSVYRKWVANESGEYTDRRQTEDERDDDEKEDGPRTDTSIHNVQPDLDSIFTKQLISVTLAILILILNKFFPWIKRLARPKIPFIARRRRILPTLTVKDAETPAGTLRGVLVEYRNKDTDGWVDVIELTDSVDLLQHEIGVRFTGTKIPAPMLDVDVFNTDFKMRITGTILGDSPISVVAKRDLVIEPGHIGEPDVQRMMVQLTERYGLALVRKDGPYKSSYIGSRDDIKIPFDAKTRDDLAQMLAVANATIASWSHPRATGSATIAFLEWQPQNKIDVMGQSCVGMVNRQISFLSVGEDDHESSPVVVGITYDFDRQSKMITLDQFRKPSRAQAR